MCIENLEGDYYIPGTQPDGAEGVWREAQDSKLSKKFKIIIDLDNTVICFQSCFPLMLACGSGGH